MDDDDAPRLRLDGKFYMTPTGLAQLREELTTLMNVEPPPRGQRRFLGGC